MCEKYLPEQYNLEVVDMYQQPDLARAHQVIAAPTLVRELPLPLRKFIGDLSNIERLLVNLEIHPN